MKGHLKDQWQVGRRTVKVNSDGLAKDERLKESVAVFDGKHSWVHYDGYTFRVKRIPPSSAKEMAKESTERNVRAPMTGKVTAVLCAKGELVKKGQPLLKMEAMKMEYTLSAATAGTIEKIACKVGEIVEIDQILIHVS